MHDNSTVSVAVDGRGVATVALNRPDKRNAMSGEMIAELTEAAASLGADPEVRVVVMTGKGSVFCAGADLGWMRRLISGSSEDRRLEAGKLAAMLGGWNTVPKPVIARVNGSAYGGGLGLVAVADIVVASEGATFGLTETRLGLIPATISPYVFARLGEGGARRTFITAKTFGSSEAAELGLVNCAVPPDEIDATVEAEVQAALLCAPGAVAEAKSLIRLLAGTHSQELLEETASRLVDRWQDRESLEGIAAFFERRKPDWVSGF